MLGRLAHMIKRVEWRISQFGKKPGISNLFEFSPYRACLRRSSCLCRLVRASARGMGTCLDGVVNSPATR